jgi:tRNA (mo5U34)-methyltransferase
MTETEILLAPLSRASSELRNWVLQDLPNIGSTIEESKNGHLPKWRTAFAALQSPNSRPSLDTAIVSDGSSDPQDRDLWMSFHPWRKGPFQVGDLLIDTEWRSDLKWSRLEKALGSLEGLRCLDVGCGNGYHLWRMCGAGASLALGLDPFLLYIFQFLAIRKRIPKPPVTVLPFGWEALEHAPAAFDRAFSMGVLYHCDTPLDHLRALKSTLALGGKLILETITIPESHGPLLEPPGRYAQMRNVHHLPTLPVLEDWLSQAGFGSVEHVDTTVTSTDEQRATEWMTFHSLANYLDPNDPSLTVEGHPAPRRSILIAG